MSDDIKLSPKYGVNPTISQCFWCGEDIGVALMGLISEDDPQAPKRMVLDFTPCDSCKEHMSRGLTVIEATEEPNNVCSRELTKGVYPTSRWVVISNEAASRIFKDINSDKVLMDPEMFNNIFGSIEFDGQGEE